MDAFAPIPPEWTTAATHSVSFRCPTCNRLPNQATKVWLNRRSPVYTETHRKKWQEFYHCECGCTWWGWSSDRPPTEFTGRNQEIEDQIPPSNLN